MPSGANSTCSTPSIGSQRRDDADQAASNDRRARRLVEQAFSRHSVENLCGRIGVLCDGLLDGLAGRETVDLLEAWARPLPVAVICELLGLPEEHRPMFTRWAKTLFRSPTLYGMLLSVPTLFRLQRYFRGQFEQCR